jgi:TolB-like protein/tetratricopeptide (TPR) repeat protein
MDPLIGTALGRYRVLAELGRGGMGVVYRALDTTLNREVALKVLPAATVGDDDRRRLLREAQMASQLDHAHIGVVHEVGEAGGVTYIAMELMRGGSLGQLLGRRLPLSRALDLATEVAEGLARAHEGGVVHRDLKPANVMITGDGHAKIIDFGLAKAVPSGEALAAAETAAPSTSPGLVKGTAAYMSPEQARAEALDARSDIFSFGVMFYQMMAGHLPFQGASYVDTLHAIVHDPAPALVWPAGGPSAETQQDLRRLIDKCLAKDPGARYQTARDLVVDLRSARRRLEGGTATSSLVGVAAPRRAGRLGVWGLSLAAVVLAAAGGWWATHRVPPPAPLVPGDRPSVAVLYFQNNTGNAQLDWLRAGLTNMVVTDLSQSPDVEVLSTDRMYQILAYLKRQNDPVLSSDTVREVARLGGVRHVLLGNYVKAGDAIRLDVTVQDAVSGRIVSAEHLEAPTEASLFSTVDDLTRRVQSGLSATATHAPPGGLVNGPDASRAAESGMYRDLREVSTSSIDAFRAYSQGVTFLERGEPREAEPLLLKAIELDPSFALAMGRLAAVEYNLRRPDVSAAYAKRARDLSSRLSARDRLYLDGVSYGVDEETVERGIAAFHQLLVLDPEHYAAKHNLALLESEVGLDADSVRLGEELRQNVFVIPTSLSNLAGGYVALDQFDQARAVTDDELRRFPASADAYRQQASFFTAFVHLDEARAAYDRADTIDGGDSAALSGRWALAVLAHDWTAAGVLVAAEQKAADPFAKFAAALDTVVDELYHGRSGAALAELHRQDSGGPWGPTMSAQLNVAEADLELALGRPQAALPAAERARRSPGQSLLTPLGLSRARLAIALSALGRDAEAQTPLAEIATRAAAEPGSREKSRLHEVAGLIALGHHDTQAAISELTLAEALLPARSDYGPPPPQPRVWFALASAYLAAGKDDQAEKRLTRLTSGAERVFYPVEYVRSLFLLGQIADRRGDEARTASYYRQFVDYWDQGDMDRDRVAAAKAKLASR